MKTAQTSTDLVRTYLREIGRVPLLTHEQEILYGKQVQRLTALQEVQETLWENLGHQPTFANGQKHLRFRSPSCKIASLLVK
jgi:RNA polymerase nonessential primary-like sigma factor